MKFWFRFFNTLTYNSPGIRPELSLTFWFSPRAHRENIFHISTDLIFLASVTAQKQRQILPATKTWNSVHIIFNSHHGSCFLRWQDIA